MSLFEDAFAEGIKAHQDAVRAVAEIVSTLEDLARALESASGNRVRVERGRRLTIGSFSTFSLDGPRLPALEPNDCLVAHAVVPKGAPDSRYTLATYELSPGGYPVTLKYADEVVQCLERESLVKALERLLKHPDTGGKLFRLINASKAAEAPSDGAN